jgi:hypothetical protein
LPPTAPLPSPSPLTEAAAALRLGVLLAALLLGACFTCSAADADPTSLPAAAAARRVDRRAGGACEEDSLQRPRRALPPERHPASS